MKMSANGKRLGRPPIYTPEERAERDRQKRREFDKKRLANLTPEQKQRRKEADARYKAKLEKTPELLAKRAEYARKSRAKRRAAMTPEQADAERAKKRSYNQAYELSPEQRARANERSREWYSANKERRDEVRRLWAAANPDAYRIYAQNRRARKREQAGVVSIDIAERLLRLQRNSCATCRQPLGGEYEIDHIEPLSRGGANDDSNLQLLCQSCNRAKGAKDPVEFMRALGFLL